MKVDYGYGIGLALRNSPVPLRSIEICNFLGVFCPRICSYRNNDWENSVKCVLTRTQWIQSIEKLSGRKGRLQSFYSFTEEGKEKWEKLYPKEYPNHFLAKPELHEKLYDGKLGFPSRLEVEDAKVKLVEMKAIWKKEMKAEKRNARIQEMEIGEPLAKRERMDADFVKVDFKDGHKENNVPEEYPWYKQKMNKPYHIDEDENGNKAVVEDEDDVSEFEDSGDEDQEEEGCDDAPDAVSKTVDEEKDCDSDDGNSAPVKVCCQIQNFLN